MQTLHFSDTKNYYKKLLNYQYSYRFIVVCVLHMINLTAITKSQCYALYAAAQVWAWLR